MGRNTGFSELFRIVGDTTQTVYIQGGLETPDERARAHVLNALFDIATRAANPKGDQLSVQVGCLSENGSEVDWKN